MGTTFMRWMALGLLAVALTFGAAAPAQAQMGEDDMCVHDATIESLIHCVHHALEMGHITSAGVATSLVAKLEAAQLAVDNGQTQAALRLLDSFVLQVEAQSGLTIVPEHAEHLVHHAHLVMEALE